MLSSCKKNLVSLYLILLGLHCFFILMGFDSYRFYSKLMLLPFLVLLLLVKTRDNSGVSLGFIRLPLLALTSSFAGDLFLTFKEDSFFLLGMLSFMLTHVFNTIYFLQLNGIRIHKLQSVFITACTTGAAVVFELYQLRDDLGAYYMPVMIYSVLISMMVIAASNLLESGKHKQFATSYFIPGAVLFFISDGILAMNKFQLKLPMLDILVMLTYGLAQLMLVKGYYNNVLLKNTGNG